eukprot:1183695-Prorocentrum_minimum.AAC.3
MPVRLTRLVGRLGICPCVSRDLSGGGSQDAIGPQDAVDERADADDLAEIEALELQPIVSEEDGALDPAAPAHARLEEELR